MKRHVTAFDGLRALATYGVVAYHCGYLRSGGIGLDIFFPLSGFLITTILLQEYRKGRWSLKAFYLRRLGRLYPALILLLLVTLPFGALIATSWVRYLESCGIAGFYLSDLVEQHNPVFLGGLAHTWSLAVEEQFYLFFPLFLLFMLRRGLERWLAPTLLLGFAVMCGAMIVTQLDFLPVTHGGEILGGCVVGVLLERHSVPAPKVVTAVAVAGLITLVAFGPNDNSPPQTQMMEVAASIIGCVLIAGLMGGGGIIARVLSLRPLTWIGERAYGIYLWHWPIVLALDHDHLVPEHKIWHLGVALAGSTAMAAISYRYVELRFRRYSAGAAPAYATHHAVAKTPSLAPAGTPPLAPAEGLHVAISTAASGSAAQLSSS